MKQLHVTILSLLIILFGVDISGMPTKPVPQRAATQQAAQSLKRTAQEELEEQDILENNDKQMAFSPSGSSYSLAAPIDPTVALTSAASSQEAIEEKNKKLYAAIKDGNITLVKKYLREGANPNAKDSDNLSPLDVAAGKGFEVILRLLLDGGAVIDETKRYGRTPLFYAARAGNISMVRLLLNEGARVHKSMLRALDYFISINYHSKKEVYQRIYSLLASRSLWGLAHVSAKATPLELTPEDKPTYMKLDTPQDM